MTSSDDLTPAPGAQDWRREFPFHWHEDDAVTRRELLRFLAAASAGLAGATWALAARGLWPLTPKAQPVPVARATDIAANSAVLFRYPAGGEPAIAVRLSDGRLVAYSDVCTHLSCAVQYLGDERRLFCPCHDGVFDVATGAVLAGPPTRPLPRIDLQVKDGMIWATGEVIGS
jgi:Rieske Fe-S protein